VDQVLLAYSQSVNTVTQTPVSIQLLPIQLPTIEQNKPAQIETAASQQSAQMISMKNATDSANELVQDLTLIMNKAHQEIITMQILEVVAGADSVS
jgi:F-type H+-transporting ATPase subunit gamma